MNNVSTHSEIQGTILRKMINFTVFCLSLVIYSGVSFGQNKVSINLFDLRDKGIQIKNRDIVFENSGDKKYISISREREDALIWLPVEEFENGTIEIVMRGINEFQRSFIGIAFHGINDSTFEAVYCRPFNFLAEDSVRRIHSIQYVSSPGYGWERLRNEHNGVYEKEIIDPPDPTGWFKMKLVIDDKVIKAYINSDETPSLVVEKLNENTTGKIGIFVADNSGGDFERVDIEYR